MSGLKIEEAKSEKPTPQLIPATHFEPKKKIPVAFQSQEAHAVAAAALAGQGEQEVRPAVVASTQVNPKMVEPVDPREEERLVRVRPIKTISTFYVGGTPYSIKQGTPCLVPLHIARLLEEKAAI